MNLRALLANGKRYEVPHYQRDYSWGEEHWEDLWDDLQEVQSSHRQHYMGALVLQETAATDQFRIIDGQQRIATLSLLFVAGLRCLNELVAAGVDPQDNADRVKLLRDTSKSPADIKSLHGQANEVARSADLDIRQRARWTNLAAEMARREKLAEAMK